VSGSDTGPNLPLPEVPPEILSEGADRPLVFLIVLAAAKISEPRLAYYLRMPNSKILLVGDDDRPAAPDLFRFPAWRVPYLGAPERWTAALSWFRGLRTLDPGPVDCVLSFELFSTGSLQAKGLAKRFGAPHVVTIAEVLTESFFSYPPWRNVSRIISRSADAFLCSVGLARDHAIDSGCAPEKCEVISPGIDLERFTPRTGGRKKDPVLLYVGELRPDKGIRDVIAACERALIRVPDLRLVIVGDGPLRAEVEEEAKRLRFVELRGKIPRDEVPEIYREARSFILAPTPRRFWAEQFGFASVEAMASGLPVVITDCGAVRDVVPAWNPICPPNDVGALTEGIVAAMGDEGDEWGRRNRAEAEQHYDLGRQAVRLREWLGERVAAHR
jgi:glycosyltransferase involved in cell wall biosynthesis